MTDLAPLHRRLRSALDVSSLLLLGALASACTTTQEKKPASDGDPDYPLPPCDTVAWCGSGPVLEALRAGAEVKVGPDFEGCPRLLDSRKDVDPKLFVGQEPLPGKTHKYDTERYGSLDTEATKLKRAMGDATTCCYEWSLDCPGGRPLIIDGRPWLANLRPGHGWSAALPEAPPAPPLPEHVRERIADAWLRDALSEHASIASFARARKELEAIAAPDELLRLCGDAAEDEVEHARLCFALAERFGGRRLEPTALPVVMPRGGGALAVARDTFVEGCVGETIAAACARRAAGMATDPVVQAVLERIAHDETEHAALAWRTIAWITKREGSRVLAAIVELAREHYPRPTAVSAADPDAALLLAYGRLDARSLAETHALAWRDLIEPLLADLGATTPVGPRTRQTLPS